MHNKCIGIETLGDLKSTKSTGSPQGIHKFIPFHFGQPVYILYVAVSVSMLAFGSTVNIVNIKSNVVLSLNQHNYISLTCVLI